MTCSGNLFSFTILFHVCWIPGVFSVYGDVRQESGVKKVCLLKHYKVCYTHKIGNWGVLNSGFGDGC